MEIMITVVRAGEAAEEHVNDVKMLTDLNLTYDNFSASTRFTRFNFYETTTQLREQGLHQLDIREIKILLSKHFATRIYMQLRKNTEWIFTS